VAAQTLGDKLKVYIIKIDMISSVKF